MTISPIVQSQFPNVLFPRALPPNCEMVISVMRMEFNRLRTYTNLTARRHLIPEDHRPQSSKRCLQEPRDDHPQFNGHWNDHRGYEQQTEPPLAHRKHSTRSQVIQASWSLFLEKHLRNSDTPIQGTLRTKPKQNGS